jgi:hypothetical protein
MAAAGFVLSNELDSIAKRIGNVTPFYAGDVHRLHDFDTGLAELPE